MRRRFSNLSRSARVLISLAMLSLIGAGLSGGCGAYQRPPALTGAEQQLLREPALPYAVTVAWWDEATKTGQNADAYATALAKLLTASGAFRSTRYERSENPSGQDLVATSMGIHCDTGGYSGAQHRLAGRHPDGVSRRTLRGNADT
jgi:hypothetical protein